MNKQLSIEQLKELREAYANTRGVAAALDELIALKSEQVPVAWTDAEELRGMEKDGCGYLFKVDPANPFTDPRRQIMLYDRPQKPVVLPGINEDLIDILGRPNFTCSRLAEIFRGNVADIKRKSENEQAFVIHWLLGVYLNHGSDWRTTAESEIKVLAAKASAGGIVKVGE